MVMWNITCRKRKASVLIHMDKAFDPGKYKNKVRPFRMKTKA